MSKQKFGMSTKFNDVAAFMFWVNEELRETLPGRDPNEDLDVAASKNLLREFAHLHADKMKDAGYDTH